MQARTRRNRVAILVSMTLCFTSTCAIQGDRDAAQRSGAAHTAYAAATNDYVAEADVQAAAETTVCSSSLEKSKGTDAADQTQWDKADLYKYDDSLTLVRYEAAETEPDDPLTTTTAVITETTQSSEKSEVTETTTTQVVTTVSVPAVTTKQYVQAEPGSVVFYSSGYGHGVGMSQNGANFYAMYEGWTYNQILNLYYPGTTLVQTGTQATDYMTVGGKTDTVLSILSQICYNEMGESFSAEAYKAQAIAAYSYYLYNGNGAGMICKSNPPQNIIDAVRSVIGIVVYYNNAPALTSFYASSGGSTASCKDIFSSDIPYLRSVSVRYDDTVDPHYHSTKSFTVAELKAKLENTYHIQLTGDPYDWISLEYGDGGYVANVVIGGQVHVRGNDLRVVLGLKSPKYNFVYQPANGNASYQAAGAVN